MDALRRAHSLSSTALALLEGGTIDPADDAEVRAADSSSTADTSTGADIPAYLDVAALVANIAQRYGGPGEIPNPGLDAEANKRWPMWQPPKAAKPKLPGTPGAAKKKPKAPGKQAPSFART
jgi:hypothetical protein